MPCSGSSFCCMADCSLGAGAVDTMKCVVVQTLALVPALLFAWIGSSLPALSQTVLIPTGSAWRYFDRGTDPGAAWNSAGYDDSGWSNGIAQFGFGDGDEATVIRQTTTAGAPIVTFYFRH